jgi:hypothetical protein
MPNGLYARTIAAAIVTFFAWSATAGAAAFFDNGPPDGKMAMAARPGSAGQIEIEAGDDFLLNSNTSIDSATFTGIITGAAPTIADVRVEIYRVFPVDSANPPDGRVPTRVNSPSDIEFVDRDTASGNLSFTTTTLAATFTAANSVLNGINPIPNQTTNGEGPVTGKEVQFNVTFTSPFVLPADHYFFVPQVQVTGGQFFWLSAPRPNTLTPFNPDLQAWIRNTNLQPDWLRVGTDIVGGTSPPTFNASFSLTGEPISLLAAVLPSSRSVQVPTPATAFATIINTSGATASSCAPGPLTSVPATFSYQTTNPMTNQVTGTPNTPVSIANGASQSFVFALTPTAAVAPTLIALSFDCTGLAAAPSIPGVNTLLYSASTTPGPDVIALAATPMNDGIMHIPGNIGSSAIAVATINIGATSVITASANTGAAVLPLQITICQTNPTNSVCMLPPASSVMTTISGNSTPTFAVFAAANGLVAFSPASNRIFVQFADNMGAVRGSTSVAVSTQ